MIQLSISINERDYNILRSHNCNISEVCRRELQKIRKSDLEKCIDLQDYERNTHTAKHRLSVNLESADPEYYYGADYKLPFVLRCIISQYVENLRRHE